MKYVLSQIIFTGFVLALYFAFELIRKRDLKYRENKLFIHVCVWSAIWSFGFFGVILQTVPDKAYLWRAIGMIGTIGYLISAQFLICHLSRVKKIYCYLTEGFSLLGIIIYFFIIQKDQVTYQLGEFGMTYSFEPTIWNNLYIWYTILVAFNQFWLIMYMIHRPKAQRTKVLGKKLLIIELAMVLGMVLDTVFPLLGKDAIPGSTIGQFAGLAVMYHAILFVNHSRITISNMSEFIYYSLDVPVLVYDEKAELKILNDKGFSFLGVDKEDMEETSIGELFAITKSEAFSFEENSQSIDAVCLYNKKECSLNINKIHDDYGDMIGYIIVVTDLSERIKSMEKLKEAVNEADYANKAKSIFLANMSHEIRTPMNAIIGFSEILLKMDLSNEIRGHVEDIKWSSQNLLTIINDILDISKIESGKIEIVESNYYVANLLNDVRLIIEPQAQKKNLRFHMKIDEKIPNELYGDKVRIRGILINILNNAVKYTSKGSVTFEVEVLEKVYNHIKLQFRVTDTGSGIKEENLSTLFDKFERLDQKVHYGIEGSGLGLAIAKAYVTLMGGEIKVSSRYGEGSVFTVVINQEVIDESPIENKYLHGKESRSRISDFTIQNTKVLVVDDNPVNLKVAKGILNTYGLEVDVALSGVDAIHMCEDYNYDIVFMDQMMPGMDGPEAMWQIRKLNDHYKSQGTAKIIVLTANAIKGTREALMDQGFDEYLGKPLNIDRLEALLCQVIAKENIVWKHDISSDEGEKEALTKEMEDIQFIKDSLPEIDVDLGLSHCGGLLEDYLKVLEITYKYGEKQMNELELLWEQKEYKTYNIKVHSIKSTTLNIGAKEVSEEAKRQEEAGLKEDYEYIDKNIEKLAADYRKILSRIKDVLVHYEIISAEPEEKPGLDDRMVKHMLRNIKTSVDAFDFAKVFNIIEEMKKYQLSQEHEETMHQLESLMEELSVDEIKALLGKILGE